MSTAAMMVARFFLQLVLFARSCIRCNESTAILFWGSTLWLCTVQAVDAAMFSFEFVYCTDVRCPQLQLVFMHIILNF
jgi:hypothetical protein